MNHPLKDRIALVTGASRGIGAATAQALAAAGAHVVLAARTVGGLEAVDDAIQAAGGSASIVPIDLRQHEMIDALAASIYERWGKLDILVGNAAMIGALTPITHADPKVWQQVMDVNVTANYRLLRSLDPLLRRADAGRVIFLTAEQASTTPAYWGMTAASKAALQAIVGTYAAETEGSNIRVNLCDPGVVRTALRAQAYPGEDASLLRSPEQAAQSILALAMPDCTRHGELCHAA
jgi:NAD(P)-dependent dehydrogenase (short-subunit alcohol dehydrogenase family)